MAVAFAASLEVSLSAWLTGRLWRSLRRSRNRQASSTEFLSGRCPGSLQIQHREVAQNHFCLTALDNALKCTKLNLKNLERRTFMSTRRQARRISFGVASGLKRSQ